MYSSYDNIWIWFLWLPGFLQFVICLALAITAYAWLAAVLLSCDCEKNNEKNQVVRATICSLIVIGPLVIFWPWFRSSLYGEFSKQSTLLKAGWVIMFWVFCHSIGKNLFYFINHCTQRDEDVEGKFEIVFGMLSLAGFIVVCAFWFY
jgi:hypothetical protein